MNQPALTAANGIGVKVDPRFENVNRWTLLIMQIFESRSFLSLAESTHQVHPQSSLEEILTQQALFRGFLLSYGKCFASGGKGRMKLDPKKIFGQSTDLTKIHDRIMELRHKFAAHADASDLDEAVINVKELDGHFEIRHLYSIANPLNEYDSYRRVIDVLDEYVVNGVNNALNSLEKQLGKGIVLHRS